MMKRALNKQSRKWIVGLSLLGCIVFSTRHVLAFDAGQFDGALWSFQMTPKSAGGNTRHGTFRVEGANLYQEASSSDVRRSRYVGNKHPLEKGKTRLTFSQLVGIKGKTIVQTAKATIESQKFGEWSGTLVDGSGKHWKFKCSRINE